MTKTLLINLPENLDNVLNYASILQPYGLAMISSVLKQRGFDVALLDAAAYEMDRKNIIQHIKALKPKILGLTLVTSNLKNTINLLKDIKEIIPDIIVVLGGPHPSIEYRSLLQNHPEVDIACIGEGEYTMLEIVNCIQSNSPLDRVKGIAFRSNGEIKINPFREYIQDLDSLPFADWQSLPMHRYFDRWTVKRNYALISASRGCPYACSFCVHNFIGKEVRRRSPTHVIEEIKMLYDRYHVRNIEFCDSTLNIDIEWLREICEELLKMNKRILWGCEFRADKADIETIKLMKKSGCIHLFIGVESADNQMLKNMKKGINMEKIKEAIRLIREAGLNPDLGFIIGLPGESRTTIMNTIAFTKEYPRSSFTFTFATPYPGTELYEIAKKEGLIVTDWAKHSMHRLVYIPKGFTREELQHYYKLAIRKVFLRPLFLFYQVKNIKSWLHFKITLRFAFRIFFKRLRMLKKDFSKSKYVNR